MGRQVMPRVVSQSDGGRDAPALMGRKVIEAPFAARPETSRSMNVSIGQETPTISTCNCWLRDDPGDAGVTMARVGR